MSYLLLDHLWKKTLKAIKVEKEDAIVKVFFFYEWDHHIVGRFKKLLGISTFGNGRDSKKDTDTTLKMIKKLDSSQCHGAFSQKMTIMTWYFFVLNSFERFFKKIRKRSQFIKWYGHFKNLPFMYWPSHYVYLCDQL